jgi:hypothetical protein
MRRRRVAAVALAVWCLAEPSAAHAQNVDPAVDDLRDHDVTYEDGALTPEELDQLDALTKRLQEDGGYFKVVVLGQPVTDFDSARAFADEVRDGIGGDGRVFVYARNEVAVSSNVDDEEEIDPAERAAADALNEGQSLEVAVAKAADELGVEPGGRGGEVSGIPWGFLLLVIGIPAALLLFMWWAGRRQRARARELSAEEIGVAETTVRGTVDKVANDLLELADRVESPDARPPPARPSARGRSSSPRPRASSRRPTPGWSSRRSTPGSCGRAGSSTPPAHCSTASRRRPSPSPRRCSRLRWWRCPPGPGPGATARRPALACPRSPSRTTGSRARAPGSPPPPWRP